MKFKQMCGAALLTVASLALAACSSGGAPNTESKTPGEACGSITFASHQFLEPGRGEKLWETVKSFEDTHPCATIERQDIPRTDLEKTLQTTIGAGAGPDIFLVPDASFATFAEAGILEPLDGVLSAGQESALTPTNDTYIYDKHRLALLWNATPYALFWNKNLTEQAGITEAPADFAALLDNARAVKEKTGNTGFVVRSQLNEASVWWSDFANWIYGFGGQWAKDGKLTINDPKNVEAVAAFKEIYTSGAFGVGDDASTYRSRFAAGSVGYVIDNSAAVLTLVTDNKVVPSSQVGASVLPFPGGSSASVASSIAVNVNSKNKELANEFLRWLFLPNTQQKFVAALFPSVIGTDVAPPQALVDENPWVEAFYKQGKDAQSVVIPGFETKTPPISLIVLTQVQRTITGDVTPQDALDQAQKEAEALG